MPKIETPEWTALLKRISNNDPNLMSLDLRRHQLGTVEVTALSEGLKNNRTLTCLNLKGNQLNVLGAQALGKGLKSNHSLTEINLFSTQLGPAEAQAIGEGLIGNQSLKVLNLEKNQLGAAGAAVVREILKSNSPLITLNLDNNQLGPIGTQTISKGLILNYSLRDLSLAKNQLGVTGAQAIGGMLSYNRTLVALYLGFNEISDVGIQAICDGLRSNCYLTKLCLKNNQIGTAGAQALIKILTDNYTLTYVNLENNQIEIAQEHEIKKLLQRNSQLRDNLHEAVKCNDIKLMKTLIKQGVSLLSQTGIRGNTPLHWAVESKHIDVIKYLLVKMQEQLLSLNVTNAEGKTAQDLARDNPAIQVIFTTATDLTIIKNFPPSHELIEPIDYRDPAQADLQRSAQPYHPPEQIDKKIRATSLQFMEVENVEPSISKAPHHFKKASFFISSHGLGPMTDNTALKLFVGDGTAKLPSHLSFGTWYHPDICHYLLQLIENQAQCLRVIFDDAGYGNNTQTFKNQLQTLIALANRLNKPALFISKEPGASNHFISGLVKTNNLILINPLGITEHAEVYQTLAELQKAQTIKHVWLSSTKVQRREYEESFVSCGPISLEVAMHILKNFTLEKLTQFWASLKTNEVILDKRSQLNYFGISILNSLLPENLQTLASAIDGITYQLQVVSIRQCHHELLATLPLYHAQKAKMSLGAFLEKCKLASSAQVVFNALLTQHCTAANIHELMEYPLLEKALSTPESELKLATSQQHSSEVVSPQQARLIALNEHALEITKPPAEFLCPITHEIMQNPACIADGYSYEYTAIKQWLKVKNKTTSPITNEILIHTEIIPNRFHKSQIDEFVNKHPQVPPTYLIDLIRDNMGSSAIGTSIEDEVMEETTEDIERALERAIWLGAKINAKDNDGNTALHAAIDCGDIYWVKQLLAKNASPDIVDGKGQTPLHKACQKGQENVVRLLLKYRANPNKYNGEGKRALDCIDKQNYRTLYQTVKEYYMQSVMQVIEEEAEAQVLWVSNFDLIYHDFIISSENHRLLREKVKQAENINKESTINYIAMQIGFFCTDMPAKAQKQSHYHYYTIDIGMHQQSYIHVTTEYNQNYKEFLPDLKRYHPLEKDKIHNYYTMDDKANFYKLFHHSERGLFKHLENTKNLNHYINELANSIKKTQGKVPEELKVKVVLADMHSSRYLCNWCEPAFKHFISRHSLFSKRLQESLVETGFQLSKKLFRVGRYSADKPTIQQAIKDKNAHLPQYKLTDLKAQRKIGTPIILQRDDEQIMGNYKDSGTLSISSKPKSNKLNPNNDNNIETVSNKKSRP